MSKDRPRPSYRGKIQREDVLQNALDTEYVLIEHGLEALDTQVHSVTLFLNQTEGRDKMVKLMQSLAHMVSVFSPTWRESMNTLEKACSTTRKNLRLGTAMQFGRMAVKVFRTPSYNPLLKLSVLGRFMGLAGYFWCDNIVWLCQNKILARVQPDTPRTFAVAWMLFSVSNTMFLLFHQLTGVLKNLALVDEALAEVSQEIERASVQSDESDDSSGDEGMYPDRYSSPELRLQQKLYGLTARQDVLTAQRTSLRKKKVALYIEIFKNSIDVVTACDFLFSLKINSILIDVLEVVVGVMSIHRMIRNFHVKLEAEKESRKKSLRHLKSDSMAKMYGLGSKDSF